MQWCASGLHWQPAAALDTVGKIIELEGGAVFQIICWQLSYAPATASARKVDVCIFHPVRLRESDCVRNGARVVSANAVYRRRLPVVPELLADVGGQLTASWAPDEFNIHLIGRRAEQTSTLFRNFFSRYRSWCAMI